jgi:hypothetical protein
MSNPHHGNVAAWEFLQQDASTGGAVRLNGTDLCMDAGDQSNGIPISVQKCNDAVSQKVLYKSNTHLVISQNRTGYL